MFFFKLIENSKYFYNCKTSLKHASHGKLQQVNLNWLFSRRKQTPEFVIVAWHKGILARWNGGKQAQAKHCRPLYWQKKPNLFLLQRKLNLIYISLKAFSYISEVASLTTDAGAHLKFLNNVSY